VTDQWSRVERMDEQATALIESLEELLAGRPIDVVVNALGTVAGNLLIQEADIPDEEVERAINQAAQTVKMAAQSIPTTRAARLRHCFYLSQCLAIASATINHTEGEQ